MFRSKLPKYLYGFRQLIQTHLMSEHFDFLLFILLNNYLLKYNSKLRDQHTLERYFSFLKLLKVN